MARILVLEPSPEVRELLTRVVGRIGHEAIDAGEALERPRGVAAVVLEPSLHGGPALVRLLRETHPDLPVVCVSIYPAGPEARELDPVAYLLKPFPLAHLTRALELAVARPAPLPLSGS